MPLGLIAVVLVLRLEARPGDRRRTTFDTPGLVLFILFVGPVILALEQVQRMDARTLPMAFGLLAFGIFALVALLWQEQRNTAPLFRLGCSASRRSGAATGSPPAMARRWSP